MSYRRSFPGIAQAWIARGDGKQKLIVIGVNRLSEICDISFLGDVQEEITLSEICTIDDGNANNLKFISEICTITTNADVDEEHTLNIFCFVQVSDP